MDFIIKPPQRSIVYSGNKSDGESASSSIIGVLLLITIVMIMGGSVFLILSSQPLPEKVPITYLSVSQSDDRVDLFNKAGDTLPRNSISILVDGVDRIKEFRKPENSSDWKTLHAGEHIYYDSPQEPKSVQVVYVGNSGQYLLASSGPATITPITIIPSLTPVPTIPVAAMPAVLQITPDSGYNNTTIADLNITGTAYLLGATVKLNGTGFADIPATNVTVVSPVQITCSFNITDVPAGFRNVVVINSDGKAGQLPGGFRVDPAGARPIADFVATPTHGNAPLTVQFNDTFTSSPVMWEWAFGDGGTSNSQNTSHQYTNPGTYTVNLTVTNDDGSYREIKTNYINVTSRNSITSRSPAADFTTNVTQIPVNGFVQFYDNSTNTPSRWQWTFGDDLFYDSHQNPIHQYINPGVFSVHLTVSNSDGSDSEIKTNYIHVMKVNHAPTLTQITNQTTSVGIPLTLKITASDQDNDRLTYSAGGLPNGATFDPATRTFAWTPLDSMAGTFSVTFTVSDGVLSDSETCRIMVNSKPKILPTVQFNANALQGQAPLTVQFTDRSVSAGTTSYQWDMNNDGIVDYSSRNPVHTYKTAGTYTVKLTVTNADGSAREIKTNYITVSSPGVMLSSALYLDQFGIRGDGTDETSKLQSAFDYARDHSIRTVVFPQNKVITITGMVRFWGGLTVVGNGSTLKRKAYASMYPGSMLSVWDGARVSGLIIDGNYWTDDYGNPETYSDNGVILGDNVVFDNNEVKNVRAYSVQVYGDSNVVITNNKIHDSYQYGITTGGGVGGESHNITVTGNTIYNCQQVGIKIRGTHGAVIRNNKITMAENSQFGRGISLYSYDLPNDDILIDGNTITGSFKGGNMDGISSDNSQNTKIRITNNIVSKCDIGIDLHFTGGTITGNKISECSTSIAGASGNIVTNNILT